MLAPTFARLLSLALVPWVLLGASHAVSQTESFATAAASPAPLAESVDVLLQKPAMVVVRNLPVSDALHRLNEASGVNVAFSPSETSKIRRTVDCDCASATVGEALDRILTGTLLEYAAVRGQIVVFARSDTRLDSFRFPAGLTASADVRGRFASSAAPLPAAPTRRTTVTPRGEEQARNHQVTGRVTSAELAPLPGVMVIVRGTTIGTITNATGNYSLIAPSSDETLVFSSLGMRTREEPIAGRTVVNVTLEAQAVDLEEVVVVGYGAQSRATITGAVSAISASDLERSSSSTTADALVGRIQGINTRLSTAGGGVVGSSGGLAAGAEAVDGRPGASTVLQIRNMGEPLVIIDGVPQSVREFNHLNAADIDNISILKDASASVYGLRAANGVILVTTKRGSEFRGPTVRMEGYYGWQNFTRYPFRRMMTAYQYQFGQLESRQNLGQPRHLSRDELELWRVEAPGYENFDVYNAVVNNPNAAQYNLNASVSGGNPDGAQYYLSVGNVNQDYVLKDNTFGRTNVQANLQARVFEGLTIGTELSGRFEKHENIGVAGHDDVIRTALIAMTSFWPIDTPHANNNPNYIRRDVRHPLRSPALYSRDVSGWQDDIRQSVSGNFWTQYVFPFGLQARGTYSYRSSLNKWDLHRYTFDAYTYDRATDNYNLVYTYPGQLRSHYRATDVRDFAQLTLSHSTALGRHSVSGLGGLELTGEEWAATRVDAVPPTNFSHLMRFSEQTNLVNNWSINRRASYMGRVNYDYAQKYLLEVLGRYDGSYLYAPDRRWGMFPGFSAGWRVTEEPFLRNRLGFLDELKLRASWGQAGREQGISPWGYLGGATYGVGTGSIFGAERIEGARLRGLPVTNLSWVTSTMRNVGVDVHLFDNRMGMEFDLFERKLTGLPAARYDVLLPIEVGYTLPNENLNSEANLGFEGALTWRDSFRGVSYSLAPNFTVSRRKILDVYKPRYGNSWDRYRNGIEDRWFGVDFGYRVIGQFQSVAEIENYHVNVDGQGNRTLLPGDLIYEDVNGDGIINALDQVPIGHTAFALGAPGAATTPIVSYGMSNSFAWRGVNLSLDWAGAAMYSFRREGELRNAFFGGHTAPEWFTNRWHRADPYNDQSEWIPGRYPPTRVGQANHSSNGPNSDFYKHNVRYIRMRRAELGYSVPSPLAEQVGLARLLVYTSVSNPFTYDNVGFLNMDPENPAIAGIVYPTTRLVNLGFRADLGGRTVSVPTVPVPQPLDD
jgi:TonB-linked SusC/RagA family outer membrane protein